MAIALDDFDTPLAGDDNGVRRRTPGDFMRDGGGTPWVTNPDGAVVKSGPRKGLPKLEKYGRPSSLGKDIENTYNLDRWNERQIVRGLAVRAIAEPAALGIDLAKLGELDPDESKAELDALVAIAKRFAKANLAAERGTHTHLLAELDDTDRDPIAAMENGEALGIPIEAQRAMLEAWRLLCLQHSIEILATEATVAHDEWRQAGTLDRIVRLGADLHFANGVTIPAGSVLLCDIKTGKLRTSANGATVDYWHSYAVQCCVYRDSQPYRCGVDDGDDERGEWPFEMDLEWAVIAHIPVEEALNGQATARLVLVDIDAARFVIEDVIMRARAWQARKDLFAFTMDPPVVVEVADRPRAGDLALFGGEIVKVQAVELLDGRHEILQEDGSVVIRDRSARHDFGVVAEVEVVRLERAVVFDEGGDMTDQQHATVRAKADELPPQAKAVLGALTKQAHAAGYPFSIGAGRTIRRWHIYRALLRLAGHFGDDLHDDFIRATLALVLPEAAQPAVELGPAIGSLTIDEAQRFVQAAIAVIAANPTITFDDAGTPMWLGVDHQAA